VLLGRRDEQARLDALLDHARSGIGGTLIVRGEPGIGKSALLRYAAHQAQGMTVLSATGIESETELAFAGLSELFHPILELIRDIPQPQAAALAGALAVGPPQATDPFTVFAATLSLLAAAAEQKPVLAIIDDAHWLDASSREALLFAARRLHADRTVMLFAVREGEGAAVDGPGVPELVLRGIDLAVCRDLLAQAGAHQIPIPLAERILAATEGNPLAILELPRLLSPEQLSGSEALPDPLPAGPEIQRYFERRVASLPRRTQQALLVAAASQSGSISQVRQACESLDADLAALEAAESAGLISSDGLNIEFRHPLMRAAVYHAGTAPARRAAHRALAESDTAQASLAERAWHLAAAAQGEDEVVASALEWVAVDARKRSGHAAAARTFERAARLTPDLEQRARRLHEAGSDSYVAGDSKRAMRLLQEALTLGHGVSLRAEIEHTRGRIEMWTSSPAAARKILIRAADQVEADDPAKAALMLVDATITYGQEGDQDELMFSHALHLAQRAYELGCRVGGVTEAATAGALGKILVVTGQHAEARPLLIRSLEALEEGESLWLAIQLIQCAAVFLWLEDFERMRVPVERMIARARRASAPGALPYTLGHLSELDFRTGRWSAAYAGATEAIELATELGHRLSLFYALVCLSWLEAARGLDADCRAHIAQALNVSEHLRAVGSLYAARVFGLLDLGQGRREEAINHLQLVDRTVRAVGACVPSLLQEAPDLIEAYVHTGQRAHAEESLVAFEKQAETTRGTWAQAAAARCRGLLAADFEPAFEEALRWHNRTTMPFERARTELCYGERLRRARRREEARPQLRSALETFEGLGAEPWAKRARNELRATGEATRGRDRSTSDELTLQELQVALKVAEGATNRETAAALFLSPKTIEAHLSRIYSKLSIRSRTELARRFAHEATGALATPG
jgi:DNA-binding CsgD family transcriptional regulator